MAPITSLPLEIFYCLVETTGLNVLNLRLTCKTLNTKLYEIHLDALYHSQNIIMTPQFCNTLLEVSREPYAPHLRARHLTFDFQVPHITTVQGLRDSQIDELDQKDQDAYVEMECIAYDHTAGARAVFDGRHKLPLQAVLSLFPRVESIGFRYMTAKRPSPFEFSLLYPSLGYEPGNCPSRALRGYAKDWMYTQSVKEIFACWWLVLNALKSTIPTRIQEMAMEEPLGRPAPHAAQFVIFPHQYTSNLEAFINRSWFEDPPFPNLRRLELYVDLYDHTELRGSKFTGGGFGRWLEKIGGRLEYLSLDISSCFLPRGEVRKLLVLPTGVGMPNLKTLDISSMILDIPNLKAFLTRSKKTLETLILANCWCSNQDEEVIFQLVGFACTVLTSLEVFILDIGQNGFSVTMTVEGDIANAGTALCKGNFSNGYWSPEPPPSYTFSITDLKERVSTSSKAWDLWGSLMFCEPSEEEKVLSHWYSEGCESDFESEGCKSDTDYYSSEDSEGYSYGSVSGPSDDDGSDSDDSVD
ncbi:hypothetical protein TWF730_010327 [Orbilia blumenaviensis]|uniref:F-box domain-containing protein n=1 Tax=Orbilia blumenaviensis TaxID=1796055 RepID=A0AAV9URT8_9PEZI